MSDVGSPIAELDTPALWVDLEIMEANIAYLVAYFRQAGVQWRPHVKSIRVPAIAHRALAAGAIGVTCATVAEAENMANGGIQDILIANQVVGPHKTARLVALCHRSDVKVAVDNATNVAALGAAAVSAGVVLGVVVEVDVGQKRAGVAPGQATVDLGQVVRATAGLRFRGLMGWEGHTRAIAEVDLRHQAITQAMEQLTDTADLCRAAGLPVEIVSGGGSGTYDVTAFHPGMTEVEAGGAIFCDVMYQKLGVQTRPCLFVRSTVTSRPTPSRIIFDAGFKTMPMWRESPSPVGLSGVQSMRTNAEHTQVELAAPNTQVELGQAFDFIVGYSDSTVFLFDTIYGVRHGLVETVWTILGR